MSRVWKHKWFFIVPSLKGGRCDSKVPLHAAQAVWESAGNVTKQARQDVLKEREDDAKKKTLKSDNTKSNPIKAKSSSCFHFSCPKWLFKECMAVDAQLRTSQL